MDRYDAIRVLGEGSFGKVYLMRDKMSRKFVCMKVIKIKNIPKKERDACRMEVDLLRRLNHPNIVSYVDSFLNRTKESLCIVMQYCDGGDLAGQIKAARRRPFSERKILHWFVQIALGMHYMHQNRILHRDLKTQNIFLLGNGRLVLGDLGISKVMDGTMDFAKTCIGTPYYMSPEIFQNKPYNHKSDVWALGCVLYELTTLNHAFDANSLNGLACKIVKGRYPPVDPKYSTHLRDLIASMLLTSPAQRPDMDDVLRKPFIRKHIYNFLSDIVSRPSTTIGDGTMAVRAAAVNAVGVADGESSVNMATNPDVRALKQQLESLNLQSIISKALAPQDNQLPAAAASPAVAKKIAREQAGALKREQEHKRMVEAALQKLREEREKRSQQKQPAVKEQYNRPHPPQAKRAERKAPQALQPPSNSRRSDPSDSNSSAIPKKPTVRPVVVSRTDPTEDDKRRVEDLDRWEAKRHERRVESNPPSQARELSQQQLRRQQEIQKLKEAKLELDRKAALREQQRAERREKERRQKVEEATSHAAEPHLERGQSDYSAVSAPPNPVPKHMRGQSTESDDASQMSARERVLLQKKERAAREEADRLEALKAAEQDNRSRRMMAYQHGRDIYASHLEKRNLKPRPEPPIDAAAKNPPRDSSPKIDAQNQIPTTVLDDLELEATAKMSGNSKPKQTDGVAIANDVDAILVDDDDEEEFEQWRNDPANSEIQEQALEHQLEAELRNATLRVEHLQRTLHETKSIMASPKPPVEPVREEDAENEDEEEEEEDDDEEEEDDDATTVVTRFDGNGPADARTNQRPKSPPRSSYFGLEDKPSPKGNLGERIRRLKERCIAILGEKVYTQAYNYLQRYNADEADFDNEEQTAVKLNTMEVILGPKVHCAALIEQILFMEETHEP